MQDIVKNNGIELPRMIENDILVCNNEIHKENLNEEDPNKDKKVEDNISKKSLKDNQNDKTECDVGRSHSSKKRMIVSDDDDDDDNNVGDNEFCFPSQKKRKQNNGLETKNKAKSMVVSDEDDDIEDGFSLPSEKKQRPKTSSGVFDSERDIFDTSRKNDNQINDRIPTSVDMFASGKSSSNRKESNNNDEPFTSLTVIPKKSIDIFDPSCSVRKSMMNDKDDCDFKFNDDIRRNEIISNNDKETDNVFKKSNCKKGFVSKKENASLQDPFQSNKLSRDIFDSSLPSTSRGVKRRTSIEEPPFKKTPLIIEDSDNESNELNDSNLNKKSSEEIIAKEEIKQVIMIFIDLLLLLLNTLIANKFFKKCFDVIFVLSYFF